MIHSREQGSGPTILLLHGFCEDLSVWEGAFDRFKSRYHVVAVDLPGFGGSKALPGDFSLEEVANAIDQWRLSHDIRQAVLVGHSLGGYICLALARKDSRWIRGLGLFHSTAFADPDEKKATRDKVVEFIRRNGPAAWTDNFIPGLFHDPKHPAVEVLRRKVAGVPAETLIRYTKAMRDRTGSVEFLQKAGFPVFYLAGTHDAAVPLESVLQQQKMLPEANFHVQEGISHMGMFEAPESCFLFISDWLEALPGAARG